MVVISRDDRGVFEARWDDDRFVRGWSSTTDEMAEILLRYGIATHELTSSAVSTATVDTPMPTRAGRLDDDNDEWTRLLRSRADSPHRAQLRDALVALRARIPTDNDELRNWLAQRTEMVNATAPQVGQIAVFQNGGPVTCDSDPDAPSRSECLDWIDARAILSTVDRVWGRFDRAERHRRSLDAFCLSLRAADSAQALETWIDGFTIGRARHPVQLVRVEGPAGPVYQIIADGTHRAHFARVFELPLMALIKTSQQPRPVIVIDHPDHGPDSLGAGFRRVASLHMGLRARGLLEVVGNPRRPASMDVWQPTRVCAEWMLLPPSQAAAVNQAYDRVYPGALVEATGLAAEQLYDAHRWARTVVRPPSMLFRARVWHENRKRIRSFERMYGRQIIPPGSRVGGVVVDRGEVNASRPAPETAAEKLEP